MKRWFLAVTLILAAATLAACRSQPLTYYPLPESGDWYVRVDGSDDRSGRSAEEAFASIERAARVAKPGDVVIVGPGTYRGKIVTDANGTGGQRITYVSETPLAARIDASGSYTGWENRGDFIDIVGFEVTGSDYQGILNYGTHVKIVGNWVHHLAVPTCNHPNGGAGINHANYAAHGNDTLGNIVHNVRAPRECQGLVHGIYHANEGGSIQNNIVFDVTFAGIQMYHAATGVTVTNNLVWGSTVGINVGGADARAEGYLVANNILIDNMRGIEESGSNFGNTNRYLNNLVHGNQRDFVMRTGAPVGTITTDPLLVDFRQDGSGDYRLSASSPAIDAGTADGAPTADFSGVARPQDGAIDVGPFEFCGEDCRSAGPP